MPRARRLRSSVATLALGAFVVALVYFFWPTSLGGCSTLTIVSGHSMEPTYFTGDLVWSRCGEPTVGDIVVYTPPGTDGARVIHRITGGDGSAGWVIEGDNNTFIDPWKTTDADVIGIAQAHVSHLGTAVYAIANPYIWVSLLLIAAAIYLWPRAAHAEPTDDAATAGAAPEVPGTEPSTEPSTEPASEPGTEPDADADDAAVRTSDDERVGAVL